MLGDTEFVHDKPEQEGSDWKRLAPILGAAVIALGGIGIGIYEHTTASAKEQQNQQLTSQLNQTSQQLAATNNELSALSAKVDAMASKPSPMVSSSGSSGYRGGATSSASGNGAVSHRSALADSRYRKMQSQLDAQNQAISAQNQAIQDTRNDLAGAKTELGGSIAKTHDELVLLEKRGERSYFEFDLDKSKQYARSGPMSISLRKANEKKSYADLELIVDDRNMTQKHVNLYQPAMFYEPDSPQPLEIVINQISKNHIHGYISAPKYRRSELTAMANQAQQQGQNNGQVAAADSQPVQPQTRKKLTVQPNDPNQ